MPRRKPSVSTVCSRACGSPGGGLAPFAERQPVAGIRRDGVLLIADHPLRPVFEAAARQRHGDLFPHRRDPGAGQAGLRQGHPADPGVRHAARRHGAEGVAAGGC